MSLQFRSLLMKEWAERQSIFRIALVFTLGILAYCVAYEVEYRTRTLIASYYSTCVGLVCLGPVLLAMSTATGEYTRKTIKFSASLPVSLNRVAWARLIGAWGCLIVPIIAGAVVVTMLLATGLADQAGLRSDDVRLPDRPNLSRVAAIRFLWTTTAIAVTYALHLSTLLSLLGTRCRKEGSVGLLGAVIVLFESILTEVPRSLGQAGHDFLANWLGGLLPGSLAINWGYGDLDGSTYTDLEIAPLIFGPLLLSLLITAALAVCFTRLYGCRMETAVQSARPRRRWLPRMALPSVAARVGIRWPGRLAALVWLNARQSVPLGLAGLLVAVVITLIGVNDPQQGGIVVTRLASHLPSTTWFVGCLWATVVAVGIFSAELKPQLEHFWRSRPLSPGAWFWMKYGIGLVAVIGALDLIPALFAGSPSVDTFGHDETVSIAAYLACMPLLHAQIYAVAVAAICQSRRMIPSAIIALMIFFIIDAVMKSIPGYNGLSTLDVFNTLNQSVKAGERLDLTSAGYPLVYGIVAAVIATATLLARKTLDTPRAKQRALSVVAPALLGLGVFFSSSVANSAEPPTAADVIAGIHQREGLVKDVRMRLSTKYLKTAAFFESKSSGGWSRQTSPISPVTQDAIYELSERPPCRAWSEVSATGSILSSSAFDGQTLREFKGASPTGSFRMATTRMNPTPFLSPDSELAGDVFGIPLVDLLSTQDVVSLGSREVDGEQLIDCVVQRMLGNEGHARFKVTFNASRHFWPIRMNYECSMGRSDSVYMRHETICDGWIDAGGLMYPRKLTRVEYRAVPFPTEREFSNPSDRPLKLEHFATKESEILEIAVNTNLPDAVFSPPFPEGVVFSDLADRKFYQVKDGTEQSYHPKPKGLQGAVFAFHLLWITVAVTCLFRRAVPA